MNLGVDAWGGTHRQYGAWQPRHRVDAAIKHDHAPFGTVECVGTSAGAWMNEIEAVFDGEGFALLGEAGSLDRFLTSASLPSQDLGLHRLRTAAGAGAAGFEVASQAVQASGRWVKLTEKSAQAMKTMPLMKGSSAGSSRAVAMDGGKTSHILEIVRTPSSMLTNPALLTGVAGLMAQLAMQQAMKEITEYLERIDAKIDDVLRAQKDAVVSTMVGAQLVIEDALTVREHVGGVSDVTWSKVQGTPATIAETQAYAIRQLDAVTQELERASAVGDVARAASEAQAVVAEWLAVLARCFQLQDAVAVLELDRLLGSAPEDLERHRAGIRVARQKRLDLITGKVDQLMARMDDAAGVASAKVLLHPRASQSITVSGRVVEAHVREFATGLGIEAEREAVEVRRWLDAATEVTNRALETGAAGIEGAKNLTGQSVDRARAVTTKLTSTIAERTVRRRPRAAEADDAQG